ncbi:mannitol dehydrogenase family protein [Cellulomonas sp. C5510]|uniref:mannitol dehydrogenase family protein n=1 Tax=Cellulomonas sp. C5510 TaxID=2871170 RepID=UPI001C95E9AE|nr:mannitol dehydrogenase family protein [Cellulomonas sp. C5510]QZN85377.1 mannitol dehydrogenase family protein [Cellulomonas sp. C5510]
MGSPPLLDRTTVTRLDPAARPLVDPAGLEARIVHLGLGAFHRAHQAVYTEQAAAATGEPWGIVAVEPLSEEAPRLLAAQDNLYSVTDRAPGALTTRVVGSLVGALHLRRDAAAVDALLRSPAVGTVTLTVTEKGYYRRPGTAELDLSATPVAADLARTAGDGGTDAPGTVVGRLAASLRARWRDHGAPLDVVSCDNMAGNGPALESVVRGFVAASAWADREAVLSWIADSVSFPATIVDRIVPATTAADRELASSALGLRDEMPVLGEPFRQWVLEDRFRAARPPWEVAGALVVPDVAPYQLMKLRLLNGSHSAMAYLGLAAGCRTVADVLQTSWGETLVRAFGAEVAPSLPSAGPDPAEYVGELVERFRNPAMQHLLVQIGSDGSLKIPERWLAALRELRSAGRPTPTLELALAAWVLAARPGTGPEQVHGTTDPLAPALARVWRGAAGPRDRVAALLRAVGAADLADDSGLVAGVASRLPALAAGRIELDHGAAGTAARTGTPYGVRDEKGSTTA